MVIERNCKIDFLRAISMLLIVVQHYVVWGIKESSHEVFRVDSIYTLFDYTSMEALYLLSCVGVNCFIMITGYFLIDRLSYRWSQLIKLWFVTFFYSVVICLCVTNWGGQKEILIKCCFPIWSDQYWFITKYFGLMLLAPFLSLMAFRLDKRSYIALLTIMFCMGFMIPYGKIFAGGKSLFWMTFVYLVGGFIRLHELPNVMIKYTKRIFCVLICVFTFAIVGMELMRNTNFDNMIGNYELHSFASDSPIFFLSLFLFVWASKKTSHGLNKFYKLSINIAPYILAVYLIHMNKYLYPYIWEWVIPQEYNMPMAVHALISCSFIFIVCIGMDFIRDYCFKLFKINRAIEKMSSKIKIKEINIK